MESNINENRKCMHVASFVLGIISIFMCLFWYVSLPAGVLAIVFGVKSNKRYASKLGKSGMILGIIGLSLLVFLYVSTIVLCIVTNMF